MSRWIMNWGRKLNFRTKIVILNTKPTAWAAAAAAKIPKAPNPTNKKGRSILQKLVAKLTVKTYLVCRCAKKTESVMAFTAQSIDKKMNAPAVAGVLRRECREGEIMLENATKVPVSTMEVSPTSSMPVLSLSLGLSELGKKRIKVALNPMRLKMDTKFMTEISAVASPISSVKNSWALMSQKKKPNPATTAVDDIRYRELRKRLSRYILRRKVSTISCYTLMCA